MDVICTNCSRPNPENSVFCVGCGNRLPLSQRGQTAGTNSSLPTLPSQNSSPTNITPQPQFGTSASYAFQNAGPSFPSTTSPQYPTGSNPPTYAPGGSSSLPPQTPGVISASPSPTQWSTASVAPPPPASQFGSMQGLASFRRAFAGHGVHVMHHSWLLPGDHTQTMAVRHQIQTKIEQRRIANLTITPEKLMERGLLMEEREYLIAKRSVASVFIYAAPAENDLYISRATTIWPPINNFRVLVAAGLFLLMLLGFSEGSRSQSSSLFSIDIMAYVVSGLFLILSFVILGFFIVMLIRSAIYWVKEKDFLIYLRSNSLNDFHIDDVMLLEHVTDDVVHSAVEQLGLDASKITPPPMGYQQKQRIRAI